jgi:hypothetical protein
MGRCRTGKGDLRDMREYMRCPTCTRALAFSRIKDFLYYWIEALSASR